MLRADGTLIPTTRFVRIRQSDQLSMQESAHRAREYVRRHWKYSAPPAEPADLLERAQSHSLCISGMAFQDAWNIDLQRLRRCCIHVAAGNGKLIPFCAYYLTNSTGVRGIGTQSHMMGNTLIPSHV